MRKLLVFPIIIVVATVLFLGFRYISSSQVRISALQVTATPQSEVFLDNASVGKTPFYHDKISPGEHTLKLVPQEAANTGLFNFEEKVTLREGVLTVVDRIFKSTEAESEVSILTLEPIGTDKAEVAVVSSPDGAEVKLDEQPQGVTPLIIKEITVSDHQITVSKEGYNSKTVRIRPNDRYRLTTSLKLSILRTVGETAATPSAVEKEATSAATVKILETPVGFLRVRREPSTGSAEIARVKPGDSLPLLEEREGWYKIKLPDEKEGWISSQYAKKS